MDMGNQLLHRAYLLVEAEIPAGEAIEDLVTLARGQVFHLEAARRQVGGGSLSDADDSLALVGFEPGLAHMARLQRAALGDLLDRAIASFG